ncbi:hypothetical protein AM493_08185 [Flavobacterium akiainvivens]|uniref:Uncharacterized protein n=1 Tax=Flavobacterium akiainvivens TaxID=1202724 RepID=A0A0M8MHQ8_9FLAO|nr:hypothetical protein [Flavobacterium akiainvivens]KOS06017.1 hypothetical protein AM493_08185 [Flavobacterium akiainvivens]SFQ54264.1 hypothetical protein SAMN05444144_107119 [Flavobacterium akiainvivens]
MKKITEAIVRKDASIHKVQFDRDWFYSLEDMEYFLKEDLSGVEAVSLPMEIFGETMSVKCATWEDIERYRHREPLQDFKSSVFRNKKNLEGGK